MSDIMNAEDKNKLKFLDYLHDQEKQWIEFGHNDFNGSDFAEQINKIIRKYKELVLTELEQHD